MPAVAQALAQAVQQHQAGQLQQAEQIYRTILQADPQQVDALHLLGVLAYQLGQHEQASAYIRQALRLKPDLAEAHLNLATVLQAQGQLEKARACYQQALRWKPNCAEVHNNLGNLLQQQGKLAEAQASLEQALCLKPNLAEAHNNLGNVLQEQGKLAAALASLQQALRLRPDLAEAHNSLGNLLHEQGQLAEAQASYQQALRLKPDYAEAHCNLGNVLQEQGKWAEALACYQQALRHQPDFALAHSNLGAVFQEIGELEQARDCYEQALRCQPDYADVLINLGIVLKEQGELEEAVASLQRALHFQPDSAKAHLNLGAVLHDLGQLVEALACYRQALRLEPAYVDAHWNRALTWLLAGDFEQAWRDYEWRWQCKDAVLPRFSQPLWDGSPLHGQTILLYAEQGLGDTLHFIRYAPLVQERGGCVLVACQPLLRSLLSRCHGIDRLLPQGEFLPPFDVWAPLLSLPRIFGTTLATVPATVPYLFADPQRCQHVHPALRSRAGSKIGIVWQGNPRYRGDRQRSIPLMQFAPLAQLPGVQLISLQKGYGSEQLRAVADRFAVLELGSHLDEGTGAFEDTAVVLQHLDLVIAPDTALAHLAGGLGVPVWLALSLVPHWPWLLEREDSPWYPSLRLFRQQERGNWDEVFARMATALRQRLAQGIGAPVDSSLGEGD